MVDDAFEVARSRYSDGIKEEEFDVMSNGRNYRVGIGNYKDEMVLGLPSWGFTSVSV